MGVDTWYRKEAEEKIEKLIVKSKGKLISVDRNALRNFGARLEKLAKIMAKAHNNKPIFPHEQMSY